jgi:hypothetical protein
MPSGGIRIFLAVTGRVVSRSRHATTAPAPTSAPPGSGTSAPSAYQQVQAWYAGVQDIYTSIQQDTEAIKLAAGKQDVTSVHNGCEALQVDVAKARAAPPPPDLRMLAAIGDATDAYAAGARACLAGDYKTTATQIDQGAYYLQRANDIMNNMN